MAIPATRHTKKAATGLSGPLRSTRLAGGPVGQRPGRLGRGDVVGNLGVGGLVLNAFLVSGDPRYAAWLAGYVGAWQRRAAANGGLIPDNVGADGVVGSQLDGRWYGGHYGWSWPHGMYSIAQATLIGAMTAALATGDERYLDLPRQLLDEIIGRARSFAFAGSDSSISPRWLAHLGPAADHPILLVPYRHSDRGWFDWNPVQASVPVALWQYSGDPADQARLDALRPASGYDWTSSGRSGTRRRPGTRNRGTPTCAGTPRASRTPCWPRRTPRPGGGWRWWSSMRASR